VDEALVHSTRPLTVECSGPALGVPVTPTADMFVRQNLDLPDPGILADRGAWTVEVDGAGVLTLAELWSLPSVTRRVVMECAGNARRALGTEFPGETPWGVGAAACVEWTGVALATLATGPAAARWCTATGADAHGRAPDPPERRVERSVPAHKALADGLLAWQLNGRPIPLVHGGPLRFVVPGYFAVNSVKFVRRIAFSDAESDADIQRTRYRLRPPGAPDGDHPTTGPLRPKSLITGQAAPDRVTGVAWSGSAPVERVEVTVDGGGSWHRAELEEVADPAAWRRFSAAVPPAAPVVASRATDATGAAQPRVAEPNAGGYANNGWLGLSWR
jgi:DMSO/TMAO reductase YedYZ molybdopterin-dependent catalytic subunit